VNIKRYGSVAAVALAGGLVLSSCAANEPAAGGGGGATGGAEPTGEQLEGTIDGVGATSQGSAQEAWVASFLEQQPGVVINYDPQGSGAGREGFLAGAADFAGSDRAFDEEELAAGGWAGCAPDSGIVELPLYISPIAVAFNLEGIETLNLDAATIAGIFAGEITEWNDEAIASQNPDVELPDLPVSPVHRSDDSGTTENFTEYLAAAAPDVWTYEPDGLWPFEGGEAADGTSGVIDAITGSEGLIGYADASRAEGLGTVSVQVGDEYVAYSPESAAAVVDASPFAEGRTEGDLAIEIDRTSEEAGVYPIVLVSYLIGCEQYADAEVGPLVKSYFSYIASEEGQQTAADAAGSAPISADLRTQIEAAIELIQ
jgi:phosphate transport system substrate-binding protein